MGQIVTVQWLRALAALVVAFGHAQHDAKTNALKEGLAFERLHALPWGSGVDLFFVISGFIMVVASERLFGTAGAARAFLARRIARIVPVYWFFLALALVWMVAAGLLGGKPAPTPAAVATSFAFLPYDTFGDGLPRPFYTLGWTLNYEMAFYAVFALFLGWRREAAVARVALVLAAGVVAGALLPMPLTALQVWTKPIVLEFALGMGIALLYRRGLVLPGALRVALALAGAAILVLDPLGSGAQPLDWITPNDGARLLAWGLPAAAIMLAAVCGPQPVAAGAGGRWLTALGDASYVLYLSHPFVILGLRRLWLRADLDAALGLWPMVALEMGLACLVALVLHRIAEVPVTRRLQARLSGGDRPAAGPVATPLPTP